MATVILRGENGSYIFDPDDPANLIHEGQEGRVFHGYSMEHNQPVVIKVLFRQLTSDPKKVERTKREGTLKIIHENLLETLDFIMDEKTGIYHIVSEYVDGTTLEEHIKTNPNGLPFKNAVEIIHQVCAGVKRLHDNKPKIIHRGIEASNIMLCKNGGLKILDYGLIKIVSQEVAKMTVPEDFLRSIHFQAPEVTKGIEKGDLETVDVYSVGALLFYLLKGKKAFGAKNLQVIVREKEAFRFSHDENWPRWVNEAVAKSMSPNPKDRPASIGAFELLLRPPEPVADDYEQVFEMPQKETQKTPWYYDELLAIKIIIAMGAVGVLLFSIALIFS